MMMGWVLVRGGCRRFIDIDLVALRKRDVARMGSVQVARYIWRSRSLSLESV
jgi:hypothetical protein